MVPEHLGQQVLVRLGTGRRHRRSDHLATPSRYRHVRLVSEMTAELGRLTSVASGSCLAQSVWLAAELALSASAPRRLEVGGAGGSSSSGRIVLGERALDVLLDRQRWLHQVVATHHRVDRGRSLDQGAVDVHRPFL